MITTRWPAQDCDYPTVEFRRMFRQIKRSVPEDAQMVTAYTDGTVTLRSNRRVDGYHEANDLSGMQGVRKGDFVVHGLDILRGSVGVSDSDGAISSVCIICEPINGAEPRYFAWLMRAQAYAGLPRALARGVREGGADFRRWDTLAELPVLSPPPNTQSRIADYLDSEMARIDALINKKQQHIQSFQKRTESLLAAQLDVAIKIYGEIPLKFVAQLEVSNVDKKSYEGQVPVRLCNYTDVYYNRKIVDGMDFMFATADPQQIKRLGLLAGDVLITKDSETADDIAVPAYVDEDLPGVVLGYHLALLRPTRVQGDFLYWALRSRRCRDSFSLAASGVTRVGLRQDAVGRVFIPNIPIYEQDAYVAIFENHARTLDTFVAKISRQIVLLREYRQALIAAAVTGGLEIPGVVA